MYKVTQETLKAAYKPFDIVEDENGSVGLVQEVNVNSCQLNPQHQISYSVLWLVSKGSTRSAWYNHKELTKHSNLMVEVAKGMCHPGGNSRSSIDELFKNF
jgi:hypothetical protein